MMNSLTLGAVHLWECVTRAESRICPHRILGMILVVIVLLRRQGQRVDVWEDATEMPRYRRPQRTDQPFMIGWVIVLSARLADNDQTSQEI